ncbi:hypothetical protein V7S43_016167 [Phytophthora oleae]|uniref:RxLR effector protein n=1 Tax=Phytophthora oleae TaxID=2107226 RepID=A0ABD3EXH7_9STRA
MNFYFAARASLFVKSSQTAHLIKIFRLPNSKMSKVLLACVFVATYVASAESTATDLNTSVQPNLRANVDSSFSSSGDAAAGLEEKKMCSFLGIVDYPCPHPLIWIGK